MDLLCLQVNFSVVEHCMYLFSNTTLRREVQPRKNCLLKLRFLNLFFLKKNTYLALRNICPRSGSHTTQDFTIDYVVLVCIRISLQVINRRGHS